MPDPISPLGSPGQPQPLAPVPAPPPQQTAPEASGKANSAQMEATQAARLEASLAQKVVRGKDSKAPLTLDEAAREFRQYLKNLPSDLQFSKDEGTGTIVFKVINPVTKEVIRQYPPEEILQVARRLREVSKGEEQSGILLDRKL